MPKRAPANPDQFEEASKWFRGRVPVTKSEWDAMSRQARRQAFTIAGTTQLRVVQTVFEEIAWAITTGAPIGAWRKRVKQKLGAFAESNSATLTTAFINANQTAYGVGRYYQMSKPEVTAGLPYRIVDAVLDGRTTEICLRLNGTCLPYDHPWWLTHWNPYHHRCRTAIRAISASMAKQRGGITLNLPRPNIPDDWGLAPPLRAGQVWEPSASDFDPAAWAIYQRSQERMKARWAQQKPSNDNATPQPPTPAPKPKRRRKD